MISRLITGNRYTRKELWALFHPHEPFPVGGNWSTGYVREGELLIVFANIGVSGRTGHDFPNSYDSDTNTMVWYGKPNSHSAQPTFRELFLGKLKLAVFARWDSSKTEFTYMGIPTISNPVDGVRVSRDTFCIRLDLLFENGDLSAPGPEGVAERGLEGGKVTTVVNKYERDPALRAQCIDHFGPRCQICGFDYEQVYGELGKGYCHVHHVNPLSEVGSEHIVNPIHDLIPVCANCHVMLHRTHPALKPEDLKKSIEQHLTDNRLLC